MTARREGDIGCVYADPQNAKKLLGWEASYSIGDMCRDVWKWQMMNPNGFKGTQVPITSTTEENNNDIHKDHSVQSTVKRSTELNNNVQHYAESAQYKKLIE